MKYSYKCVSNAPVPPQDSGSRLRVFGDRIQSPGQSLFESVWICCGLYKYQTDLISYTTVAIVLTDPILPLSTNSPVSGFLRPPQI